MKSLKVEGILTFFELLPTIVDVEGMKEIEK